MLLKLNVVFLVFRILIQKSNAEELNLNFQQNDYQAKFERIEVVRYNKEFLEDLSIVTFKYNRSLAVCNATATWKIDLSVDAYSIIQVYKFMSNEYRFFPMHFAANACKTFAADVGGMKTAIGRCGNIVGCPLRKGIKYYACNVYPDQSKFPPYIPNGDFKMEIQTLLSSKEIVVLNVYVTISRPIV